MNDCPNVKAKVRQTRARYCADIRLWFRRLSEANGAGRNVTREQLDAAESANFQQNSSKWQFTFALRERGYDRDQIDEIVLLVYEAAIAVPD